MCIRDRAPLAVFPPVKSAEDVAMSVTALRKEANRLILEADRLTEANEAAAETTALLIREAKKSLTLWNPDSRRNP